MVDALSHDTGADDSVPHATITEATPSRPHHTHDNRLDAPFWAVQPSLKVWRPPLHVECLRWALHLGQTQSRGTRCYCRLQPKAVMIATRVVQPAS
jgi:hypothetical protein